MGVSVVGRELDRGSRELSEAASSRRRSRLRRLVFLTATVTLAAAASACLPLDDPPSGVGAGGSGVEGAAGGSGQDGGRAGGPDASDDPSLDAATDDGARDGEGSPDATDANEPADAGAPVDASDAGASDAGASDAGVSDAGASDAGPRGITCTYTVRHTAVVAQCALCNLPPETSFVQADVPVRVANATAAACDSALRPGETLGARGISVDATDVYRMYSGGMPRQYRFAGAPPDERWGKGPGKCGAEMTRQTLNGSITLRSGVATVDLRSARSPTVLNCGVINGCVIETVECAGWDIVGP
jgi:hypothetical protein